LFDPTGGGNNIDLNTLIDPSLGWTLSKAYSINDNGWIVGYGRNPAGFSRAYLLIPEPFTLSILAAGALVLLRKLRNSKSEYQNPSLAGKGRISPPTAGFQN